MTETIQNPWLDGVIWLLGWDAGSEQHSIKKKIKNKKKLNSCLVFLFYKAAGDGQRVYVHE